MATLLQITNQVLKRLREDEASDLTTLAYNNLVGSLVADIANEVNEKGPGWSALDHTINVAVSNGTRVYDLSATVANGGNVANTDSPTTEKSILLWDPRRDRPLAWLFDDSSDNEGRPMIYLDPNDLEQRYQMDRGETNDEPIFFTLRPTTDLDGWELVLWPTPSAARHIRMRFNTPEAELDVDTDEATEIKVPNRPVFLGALYLALNERGEELGEPGGVAERRYLDALAYAVENEYRLRERMGYYDWRRD